MPNEPTNQLDLKTAADKYRNYLQMLAEVQLSQFVQRRVGASDIVQDTLMDATRDLHQFRGNSEQQLFAWLKSILLNNVNQAIDFHVTAQKRSVLREVSLDRLREMQQSSIALEEILVSQVNTPSQSASRHELLLAVADCLAEIKADHRQIIMLRTIQGMDYRETAQIMDRSEAACRMLWVRAIDDLRQRFAQRDLL